jgi:hypothetical protein
MVNFGDDYKYGWKKPEGKDEFIEIIMPTSEKTLSLLSYSLETDMGFVIRDQS